jgi:hypothetical protein
MQTLMLTNPPLSTFLTDRWTWYLFTLYVLRETVGQGSQTGSLMRVIFLVFKKYDCKITSKSAPNDLHFGNLFQIIPTHNWEIYRIQMSARFKMIVLARYYVQCIRKVFPTPSLFPQFVTLQPYSKIDKKIYIHPHQSSHNTL